VIAEDEPAFVIVHLTAGINPAAHPELSIRRILTEADLRTFGDVACRAYGSPPEYADMMMPSLGYATDPLMYWTIGECDGEPVTVSGYYRSGGTAVVSCMATLESHRGRGFGAAMADHILAHALEQGCTSASLRSGPLSIPLYERLGFKYVCQHRTYTEAKGESELPSDA
jgi:GNAT superfamily N-acetyltransferase